VVYPLALITPILLYPVPFIDYGNVLIGLGIFVGYEFGRYCTPDWDIMGTTSSEGWMVNELPVIGHFLFGLSSAYGSAFRRWHRSFITHFPFVSTGLRHLLLFWWIWFEIYRSTGHWEWLIFIFIGAYVGNSISDAIHWYLDMFCSYLGKE
jgi:hypothetical protein